MLEEAGLNGKSSFSDFAAKYSKDERFRNIEKMRERESLFDEFLLEVRRREKEEKAARREQVSLVVMIQGVLWWVGCTHTHTLYTYPDTHTVCPSLQKYMKV